MVIGALLMSSNCIMISAQTALSNVISDVPVLSDKPIFVPISMRDRLNK